MNHTLDQRLQRRTRDGARALMLMCQQVERDLASATDPERRDWLLDDLERWLDGDGAWIQANLEALVEILEEARDSERVRVLIAKLRDTRGRTPVEARAYRDMADEIERAAAQSDDDER